MRTFSSDQRGEEAGNGSFSNTSRIAAAINFERMALTSDSSSITSPRPMLIRTDDPVLQSRNTK